jgi:oxygen-independent coproporphyrinogen-3 oxidase
MSTSPFSVYVHVPFCARKCPYCDFNTYAVAKVPESEYVSAVCCEIDRYSEMPGFQGRSVQTVFFGGGTPSILSSESLARILEAIDSAFGICPGAELSLEANPRDASPAFLEGIREAGFNRISFGVQSFDDERLVALGRDHSSAEAREAIERAVAAGFFNVSLDLIFGTPGQTLSQLEHDLSVAVSLPVAHISTYALSIEPGTPFFQRQERGLLRLPPDDTVVALLARIPEVLAESGFARYEISNYAKVGFESRHNMAYWRGGDYLGVGAGAHSYLARYDARGFIASAERWATLASPSAFVVAAESGLRVAGAPDAESTISWCEVLDTSGLMFEFFYLGMRMVCGVTDQEFHHRFGSAMPKAYMQRLKELVQEGYVDRSGKRFALTTRGVAVADSVFERLVLG